MNKTPLNNIDQNKIIPLNKILESIEESIETRLKNLNSLEEKLDRLNSNIENVDSPFKEVKDLRKKIEIVEFNNNHLHKQIQELELINANLNIQLAQIVEDDELRKTKEAYKSLLVFAFTNINPVTDFDPAHAKHYWENLVK